jgi:hypothetical protein
MGRTVSDAHLTARALAIASGAKTFRGDPCVKCGGTERHNKINYACVACKKAYSDKYWSRAEVRERDKASRKSRSTASTGYKRAWKYGITEEQVLLMYEAQGHSCAMCKSGPFLLSGRGPKSLVIDHCHKTGRVRGLLCSSCNVLAQSKDRLRMALSYVESHSPGV